MKPKFFKKNQRVVVVDRDGIAWTGSYFTRIDNNTFRVFLNVNHEIVNVSSTHVFPLGDK